MSAVDVSPVGTERVVVGVDGSTESIDALRWAARHTTATAAHVDVITTWQPRVGTAGPYIYGTEHPTNVSLRVLKGHAAEVLIEHSATAALLVVGSRGLGEVAGLLLGSVSARCAEKARCPVLIMHATATASGG